MSFFVFQKDEFGECLWSYERNIYWAWEYLYEIYMNRTNVCQMLWYTESYITPEGNDLPMICKEDANMA